MAHVRCNRGPAPVELVEFSVTEAHVDVAVEVFAMSLRQFMQCCYHMIIELLRRRNEGAPACHEDLNHVEVGCSPKG